MMADPRHGIDEPRYHALGCTDDSRALHIAFTLRGGCRLIGVISARDMRRKERSSYEHNR